MSMDTHMHNTMMLLSRPVLQSKYTHTQRVITLVKRDAAWYTCDTTISQSCTHNALEWAISSSQGLGMCMCGCVYV